jgi:hypothetical protein
MATDATLVGVVVILLFDAPQPIENFLLNTNESEAKNENTQKKTFLSPVPSFTGRTKKYLHYNIYLFLF